MVTRHKVGSAISSDASGRGAGVEAESRTAEVQRIIDRILFAIQADGGDVDLVSVEDGTVSVRLRGTCLVCPSVGLTMKLGIERALCDNIPWVTRVVRVP